MSREAAALVRQLVETADLPDGSGVRIVIDAQHRSLSMALACGPEPQDDVISSDGARVFLSQRATGRLERRTLKAELTEFRSAFFQRLRRAGGSATDRLNRLEFPETPSLRRRRLSGSGAYMRWAVGEIALSHPHPGEEIPANLPLPRWGWDGLLG